MENSWFLGSSIMVAQTPIYSLSLPDNDSSVLDNRLKTIEESINLLVASTCMENKTGIQTVHMPHTLSLNNSEPLGLTTDSAGGDTWASITTARERNENDTP